MRTVEEPFYENEGISRGKIEQGKVKKEQKKRVYIKVY